MPPETKLLACLAPALARDSIAKEAASLNSDEDICGFLHEDLKEEAGGQVGLELAFPYLVLLLPHGLFEDGHCPLRVSLAPTRAHHRGYLQKQLLESMPSQSVILASTLLLPFLE